MSISKSGEHNGSREIRWMVNRAIPGFTTVILKDGGDRRDRTDDLKLAKLPLYQLSYVPSLLLPKRSGYVPRRKP